MPERAAIYLGTQGWSYKDWVGPFYPPGTSSRDYLSHYARVFDAVELDTTFYGIPAPSRVDTWSRATPDGFRFTAKVPRSITHDAGLSDAHREMQEFLRTMDALGEKLGPILIQLPPDFTADALPTLSRFLTELPSDYSYAVEFRHRTWLSERTYELLSKHGVAWTMIDLAYMPRHVQITADFTYVRWLGNRRQIERMNEVQIDRRGELDTWAEELEAVAKRVQRIYGFANNHYSGHSPADVRYLHERLGLAPRREEPEPRQGTLL